MATVQSPPKQLVGAHYALLDHVSWKAYEALAESWAELPRRMTYDRGLLEINRFLGLRNEGDAKVAAAFLHWAREEKEGRRKKRRPPRK